MAGGWASDGAVNEQIEVSTQEALARVQLRARRQASVSWAEGAQTCAECDDPIPEARRRAVPGVTLCIACQSANDRAFRPAVGINRRGSKDSQLR